MIPAGAAVRLPDGASFDTGASLGVPAITAHRALTVAEDGPRRLEPGALAGTTVLVAGGAGAVGHAAIQLARWAGATVISTISGPAKAALATAAGAHHVVNYREGDPVKEIRAVAPDGVDVIAEVALAAEPGARPGRAAQPRHDRDLREQRRQHRTHRHPAEHGAEHPVPVPAALHGWRAGARAPRPPTSPRRCATAPCRSARSTGCRWSASRSPPRPTPTRRSRADTVGKVLVDVTLRSAMLEEARGWICN